jgi:hypothetical protein
MRDIWGNYGSADTESALCGFTWTLERPRDEGHESAAMSALLAARRAQLNGAQTHPVQLTVFACLTCGHVDGRTEAGGTECHDCYERRETR